MAKTPIYSGSYNLGYLFALNSGHTSIVQSDGTTPATTLSHAIAKFGGADSEVFISGENFGAAADGGPITITTLDKDTAWAIVDHSGVNKAGAADTNIPELKSADSLKSIGGTSGGANAKNYLFLGYTPSNDATKAFLYAAVVTVDPASIAFESAADQWQQVTVTLNKISAKSAITITTTLLDDDVVTVPGTAPVLGISEYFRMFQLSVAA